MCGIAGYYGLDDTALLDAMNKAQASRGPDGDGVFTDGAVGLAHRRLAIIDRAGGIQPMSLKDKSLTTVYNGEIYNYKSLRTELEEKGRVFLTQSDTEIILHGYREWGDELWDKLNGMFAVALYDKKDQSLRLVRDHFGIKPLYVAQPANGQLLFSSEIKALLATGKVRRLPNDKTIYRYLTFRIQDDSPETFFQDITRVESGQLWIIKKGKVTKQRFTKLEEELANSKGGRSYDEQAVAEFAEAFKKSVTLRLQSEVPVGTSLSGGLDSSAVAAVIAEQLSDAKASKDIVDAVGAKQNTFSAVFPNSANDEEKYVDAFLEQYGEQITAHKIYPTSEQFTNDLADFIRTQEEPIVSTGPYAQYQVMKEASKHVTVLLDGQGADEMMAGYVPYYIVYLRELRRKGRWGKLFVEAITSADVLLRLTRSSIRHRLSMKKRVSMKQLLKNDFSATHKHESFAVIQDDLKKRLVQDVFHHSIPSLLRYEDRNTMRFSLEGRVPFLDKELFQTLFSYDSDAIIKHGVNKRALRDAMKGRLPELIRARRNKIGFTTPEYEWAMRLKKEFYTVFNSQSFTDRPYFNGAAVLTAFEEFVHDRNDASTMLFWRMMNTELWLREFIDELPEDDASEDELSKPLLAPNEGKKLDIAVDQATYRRFPIQTERVSSDTDITKFISGYVGDVVAQLTKDTDHKKLVSNEWYLYVSEKIVAISQGRSYFIWDIQAGFWARFLSRFVTRTKAGIGLGSPWTMEIAIREAGLLRILYATVGSVAGKLIGRRGVFYNLAGSSVRAIDGPTQYSVFPSNVSAKLPPLHPQNVAEELTVALKKQLPDSSAQAFGGVVIIDANDLGQNILGSTVELSEKTQEKIFGDNPLGQGRQQTPLAIVVKL